MPDTRKAGSGERLKVSIRRAVFWPLRNTKSVRALIDDNPIWVTFYFGLLHRLHKVRLFHVRVKGTDVWLRSGTPDVYVAAESLGDEWDPVIDLLSPDSEGLIIDGGGYIGTAAIKLAKAFPRARVVTVEPSSTNLQMLRRNIAGIPNIEVLHAALGAAPGSITLSDVGTGGWGFTILEPAAGARKSKALETVQMVTIPDLLARFGAAQLLVLKLDVEGAEAEILEAGSDWFGRVKIFVAELHPRLVPRVDDIYARASAGRVNSHLPGEKVMSIQPAPASA